MTTTPDSTPTETEREALASVSAEHRCEATDVQTLAAGHEVTWSCDRPAGHAEHRTYVGEDRDNDHRWPAARPVTVSEGAGEVPPGHRYHLIDGRGGVWLAETTDEYPEPSPIAPLSDLLNRAATQPEAEVRADERPHPQYPCPTVGCGGDARYAPPGRGHLAGCTGPIVPSIARKATAHDGSEGQA